MVNCHRTFMSQLWALMPEIPLSNQIEIWSFKCCALHYLGFWALKIDTSCKYAQAFTKKMLTFLSQEPLSLKHLAANKLRNKLCFKIRGSSKMNFGSSKTEIKKIMVYDDQMPGATLNLYRLVFCEGKLPCIIWNQLYNPDYMIKEVQRIKSRRDLCS
mgnify:CR=1 FL=1